MQPEKLDSLTSVRFFAAAAIVIGHLHERFGSFGLADLPLDQGVSFFFVLSGFILHYNYRYFASLASVKRFIVARIARIWPVHIACLGLFFLILPSNFWYIPYPYPTLTTLIIPNIILVQSWIPARSFFISLNGVAWSISNEFFFYLMLPVVLVFFRSIFFAVVLSFAVLVAFCFVVDQNGIPTDFSAGEITAYGLIYVNPLVRIFEFLAGAAAARIFVGGRFRFQGALAEFSGLAAVILFLFLCPLIAFSPWFVAVFGRAFAFWFLKCGGMVVFVFLIYALAGGKGLLSRGLSAGWLVFLGEISFSIYMTHQILNRAWGVYFGFLQGWPLAVQALAFWVVLLTVSAAMFLVIETRARKAIMTFYDGRRLPISATSSG